jgi:long-chain acyl-CoA synthetase
MEFIQPEKLTLDRLFAGIVEKYEHLPALAFVDDEPFTYKEFGEKVSTLQTQLQQLGLQKQEKVVLLGGNSPNWAVAYIAVITMGAIAVPVMDEFPESDIEHTVNHSDAAAIFIDESLYNSLNLPSLEKMKIVLNLSDFSVLFESPQGETLWQQLHNLPDRFKKSSATPPGEAPPPVEIDEEDLAEILYTSGTTGHSKGVMLTHKNLVSNIIGGPRVMGGIAAGSVVLGFLPLAHAFGCTNAFLSIIYSGASIHYLKRKPSPRVLMAGMASIRPTHIAAVPLIFDKIYHKQVVPQITGNRLLRWMVTVPMFRKILYKIIGRKVKAAFGGRLELAVIGGASFAPEVETFMREAGIGYIVGYGMSECSPLITGSTPYDNRFGSCGYPIEGADVKIVDPDPETGIGEILTRGPQVMRGYYKNEAETKKVFTDDGWLITGDRGYLDADNYLYIKGRSKNVVIGPSGENIYPEIIEDKLKGSLYVEEALVYELEGKLIARVYPNYPYIESLTSNKEEAAIAEKINKYLEDVRVQINGQLPSFSKLQQIVEQREPFIKTPTNKIKRAEYVPNYGQVKH